MSTQECKYHFYKKNAKKLQVFFYILDCVLLKKKIVGCHFNCRKSN